MSEHRKHLIQKLLKGIETGDPESVTVVNEAKYIQHNPQTKTGGVGLAELFARLAKTNPHVNVVRSFSDGDYVFAHTEYDFATRRIGFEVFRFEGDQAVEHWDNIQPRRGPGPSGRSMVDGPTEATHLEATETNRELARNFTEQVLIGQQLDRLSHFVSDDLRQHSPHLPDSAGALAHSLTQTLEHGAGSRIHYQRLHRVLAEGCFVLCVSEGYLEGEHTAFYDLYRFESDLIVEHWDTVEHVAPQSEWQNDNGKF